MIRTNSNKDSSDKFLSEEILSDKDKMVNLKPLSTIKPMYWGFDLSPPRFIYPNYLSK
jgi:hypothetical protein